MLFPHHLQPVKSLFLISYFAFMAECRPPDEPTTPSLPSSAQLLPDSTIQKVYVPLGSSGRGQTGSTDPKSFTFLQLNLCNSGFAKCYADGASISEGSELIYATAPNVVTVNEICSNDITELQNSVAEAWPNDYTYSVFMSAGDKSRNARYRCTNGNLYGSVVIGRVAGSAWKGVKGYGGQYSTQDAGNEQRIFACAAATGDHFACTTHLSAKEPSIALTQCKALMFEVVPYLKGLSSVSGKTVVGGDLNLKYDKGGALNVQQCVPNGYTRKGDGDVQHVTFTNDLKSLGVKKYGMSYTDHDGFLVRLMLA